MSRAAPVKAELFDPAFLEHRVHCFAQEMGQKCPRCAELRDAAREREHSVRLDRAFGPVQEDPK